MGPTPMDAIEIAEFLGSRDTGVLSMAEGSDGYGIPVSYTYDEADQHVYLRLGYTPDSRKREFVDEDGYVSFVVYDETEDGWKSVVARGRIKELAGNSLDSSVVEAVRGLDIPYVDVHGRSHEDLRFAIARIDVSDLNGIAGA